MPGGGGQWQQGHKTLEESGPCQVNPPDTLEREVSYRLKGDTFLNVGEEMLQGKVAQKGEEVSPRLISDKNK